MGSDPVTPEPQSNGGAGASGAAPNPSGEPANPEGTTPTFTHFESPYPTTYELPLNLECAAIGQGEQVGCWLGPVNIPRIPPGYESPRGVAGHAEVDTNAINTLLFTGSQVIGVMIGPDDLQNLWGPGPLKTAANKAIGHLFEGGIEKGVQFGALNANHWHEMVEALTAQPLEAALQNHLNFGLPYEQIKSVELRRHRINPGMTFHLGDGSDLRYVTFKRDKLAGIGDYLTQQFVTVR